jgi:hypothetical protein
MQIDNLVQFGEAQAFFFAFSGLTWTVGNVFFKSTQKLFMKDNFKFFKTYFMSSLWLQLLYGFVSDIQSKLNMYPILTNVNIYVTVDDATAASQNRAGS